MPKTNLKPKARAGSLRPLTRRNADRIRVLVDACATLQSDGKLELMPGSKTFGGLPLAGLTAELNMLLHGFESSTRCKEV